MDFRGLEIFMQRAAREYEWARDARDAAAKLAQLELEEAELARVQAACAEGRAELVKITEIIDHAKAVGSSAGGS